MRLRYLIALTALLVSCASPPAEPAGIDVPVTVQSVEIQPGDPGVLNVISKGITPPCGTLTNPLVTKLNNEFAIAVTARVVAEVACEEGEQPFVITSSIDISALPPGVYGFTSNGVRVTVELPLPAP